ncbi:MAG: glycosyltransferase family 4 protein [Solirubrobacteraceae bacterium]|nr:glycosyltransferase family 4 protein [Solirubrobacteraceae bacterium]
MSDTPEYGPPLKVRYVLVSRHVAYRDADGAIWLSGGWWQDVMRHLAYVRAFRLVSPVAPLPEDLGDLVKLEPPAGVEFEMVALPTGIDGVAGIVRRAPAIFKILRAAIRDADIVQPDNIGWPVGWLACRIGTGSRKVVVVVVENGHWRALADARLVRRAAGAAWEFVIKNIIARASIVFYTQALYRESLPPGHGRIGEVIPASWVDDADLLTPEAVTTAWERKPSKPSFLFAGRLIEAKGTGTLAKAVSILRDRGVSIVVDFIGDGPLRPDVEAAGSGGGETESQLLDEVPYGVPFFELVDRYHGLVVPVISDEQPRIVFDGYARSVPCVASDADGIRPHVTEGETGWTFSAGDPVSLADALEEASASIPELQRRGRAGLKSVAGVTHSEMHRRRHAALERLLSR